MIPLLLKQLIKHRIHKPCLVPCLRRQWLELIINTGCCVLCQTPMAEQYAELFLHFTVGNSRLSIATKRTLNNDLKANVLCPLDHTEIRLLEGSETGIERPFAHKVTDDSHLCHSFRGYYIVNERTLLQLHVSVPCSSYNENFTWVF